VLVWNPWGLFGLTALIVCTAMGTFVFATLPDRRQNRRLSVLLIAGGILTFGGPPGATFAGSDAVARAFFAVHFVMLFLVVALLLRFLATIDTPLARPLASHAGALLPWIFCGVEIVLFMVRPTLYIADIREPWWGGRMLDVEPLANIAYALSGIAVTYSLIVAISSYRRALAGTAAKERARRYAIAFGFNDVVILLVTTIVPAGYAATHAGDIRPIEFVFVWAIPIASTVFVVLMAYGILRSQLFDIDLRLAAGLRRGAIAAIVLFAFLTTAELADRFISEEFGYLIGAFAAAALVFVHKPVERFASSFSSAVLPGVAPSEEYVAFRKLEVYLEAVEAAYDDGHVSDADRVILKRLQAKLGVAPVDAARLEEDARRRSTMSANALAG
jgi:hypothetical protein